MIAKRFCPICSNDTITKLQKIEMDLMSEIKLPKVYDVVCCERCGFCYADTSASKEDYDFYYKNCNVYSNMPKAVNENETKFYYFREIISRYLNKESLLLNIGIGDGIFEVQASENGYKNVIGIDPSKSSVKKLEKHGIQAYEGSIYDSSYKQSLNNKVEAVFLFDVLEHLLNLNEAINKLTEIVENNTKLFITVPNCGELNKNSTLIPNNFNQEHINYFSRQSLKNLMRKFGFEEIYFHASIDEIYSVYNYNINQIDDKIIKDECTSDAMKIYFESQIQNSVKRNQLISSLKAKREPLIVWGIGAYTMNLLSTTELSECDIKCFVDNNPLKSGTKLNHLCVKLPSEVEFDDAYTILVCSMLNSKEIEKQIKSLKLKNKLIIL